MKLLETRACRYDAGMVLLSWGRIQRVYQSVANRVPKGSEVLEVGCGTGGVTRYLLARGCRVTGIDRSTRMLAIAQNKLDAAIDTQQLRLQVLNLIQLDDAFVDASFDCVICCLVLSELTQAERRYALDQFCRLVRIGGSVVLADEIAPGSRLRRVLYHATRLPMAVVTYLLTQTTTRHTNDLSAALCERGLQDIEVNTIHGESFQIASGRRPACRLQPQP